MSIPFLQDLVNVSLNYSFVVRQHPTVNARIIVRHEALPRSRYLNLGRIRRRCALGNMDVNRLERLTLV